MATKKTANKKTTAKAKPKPNAAKAAKAQVKAKQKAKQRPKAKTSNKASQKSASQKQVIAKFPTAKGKSSPAIRRPVTNNPDLPLDYIADMEESFRSWRDELEDFSRHLRALDRKRLNGVGLKKLGFIGRALLLAAENPEFLPHYLTLQKFQEDNQYFLSLRSAFDVLMQVREILWNIIIEAADVLYTDTLEYYSSVQDAAKRRVDPAETLYKDLAVFFKSRGNHPEEDGAAPTKKQLKRDFNSLQSGKRDGKIVIENIKPHITGGKHEVIDETFKDSAKFKESEEGSISE
ncbi:MAG: hypothetical protein LBC76_09885 [Treponema sp.]|jgi:hypothetical protein|nr:hypothetical protein [Treponema sp.]